MKNVEKITAALLLSALFFGCRKEEPVVETGTPVFYVHGTLNGSPLDLTAGDNNYYMYSSYASDANGVYEFTGDLRKNGSSTYSASSLKVIIRDYDQHTLNATLIDSSLRPGVYSYVAPSVSSTTINFTALPQGDSVISYSWAFGDNTTSTQANPSHTYNSPGYYYACLTVNYMHLNQACSSSFCDSVLAGTPPCMTAGFNVLDINTDSIFFNDSVQCIATASGGTSPYTYSWDFGDSSFGTGNSIIHSYLQPGLYTVVLTAGDASGCSIRKKRNVATHNWPTCVTNFDWQQGVQGNLDLSKVVICWTDAGGTTYRSDGGAQPFSSSFQLVSAEEYQPNENNQRTKKIKLLVTCTLFNGVNSILLQNAEIVFSVAYP